MAFPPTFVCLAGRVRGAPLGVDQCVRGRNAECAVQASTGRGGRVEVSPVTG